MKRLLIMLLALSAIAACKAPMKDQQTISTEQDIYQLYPTSNMWTFIKLNTRNGKLWQVQYDVRGDNRFEVVLSNIVLADDTTSPAGRFVLYETQNMYNFILLDQITGKTWQVQWSIEEENRAIIPISD